MHTAAQRVLRSCAQPRHIFCYSFSSSRRSGSTPVTARSQKASSAEKIAARKSKMPTAKKKSDKVTDATPIQAKKVRSSSVSPAVNQEVDAIRSLLRISVDGEEALKAWEKKPSAVRVRSLDAAIQVAARTNIAKAQAYFREMLEAGIKPTSSTFDDLIYSPDRKLTFEKGIHYYAEMVQMGVRPTDNTLRQILELCSAHHRVAEAVVFFEELKRKWNVAPTRANYQLLIELLRKANRMHAVLRYFRELENIGVPSADTVFPIIIQLCRSNLVDDALQLYEKYHAVDTNPRRSLSLLAMACGRVHKGALIVPVYESWKARGNSPDFALLNTLIDCFAKSRLPEQAHIVYAEMKDLKFEPSEVTLSLMMKAYGPKRLRAALHYYSLAMQLGLANSGTYTLAIRITYAAGDMGRAFQIYSDMLAAGCEPTCSTFSVLIQCCGKTKDEQKMRDLFDSMKDFGLRPNEAVYTAMIFSFGLLGLYEEAIRHFFAVEQSGLHQSELTYASVIAACGNCGHLDRALEFFEEMKVLEMRRGPAVYEALIRACIHCFRSDLAVWHYQQMLSAQITPSPLLRLEVETAIEKKKGGTHSKHVAFPEADPTE